MGYIVNEYTLDSEQERIVFDNSKSLLVVAGAGSGKTLTIIGKIKYLVDECLINPSDILCISFTNESTNSLKQKLGLNIDVMTFHKLAISILEYNNIYFNICSSDYLDYVVHEFFHGIIYGYKNIMKMVLSYFDIFFYIDVEKRYKRFVSKNYKEIIEYEKLFSKFIRLLKTNNYSLKSFIEFKKCIFFKKEKLFLSIALNIFLVYQNELKSCGLIDFDDMIIQARNTILSGGFIKRYKYIIIDEFQDTSYIRYLLIKSIIDKTDANIMAVGDDFQSIYKFTGCDIDLFVNFDKYFQDSKILKIQTTYRNSQELIQTAGLFVMKNDFQIKKNLTSSKKDFKPIKIVNGNNLEKLLNIIEGNIMILMRNNFDIKKYLNKNITYSQNQIKFKNKTFKCYTVHRSKGLEEDNVIVLNVVNDKFGFPNKIVDNKIMRLVSRSRDNYDFSEERRLFYVALTRTKNNVYLLTDKYKYSIFIKELIRDHNNYIEILNI